MGVGYAKYRSLLLTGTGYAAHNECAVRFVAGRDDPASDLPDNPLVPYLRTSVDEDAKSVTASVLGAAAHQTAWYVPGYGCTLADERPDFPAPAEASANEFTDAIVAAETPAAVTAALGTAFDDGYGTRAVVVLHDGELVAERYADGFTKDTPQLGWSMSKSATNLLVGRLVQEGRVDIAKARAIKEWTDDRSAITLDHLMRMTSGLHWDETYDVGTVITQMLYNSDDMGAYAASQKLEFPVGSTMEYSTGSSTMVCYALKQQLGDGPNLAREELIDPIGMSSAVWEPDASGTPGCGSYLWATPRDWAALGQFVLDDGVIDGERLLPEGWVKESTTATVLESEVTNYGRAWWTNLRSDGSLEWPELPADTYWADGHDGQRVYVVPSADLVVTRMGFTPSDKDTAMISVVQQLVAAYRAG